MKANKDLLARIEKAEKLLGKLERREQRRGFTSEQQEHYASIAQEIDTYKAAVAFEHIGNAEAKATIEDVEATIAGIELWLDEPLPPASG